MNLDACLAGLSTIVAQAGRVHPGWIIGVPSPATPRIFRTASGATGWIIGVPSPGNAASTHRNAGMMNGRVLRKIT